MHELACWSQFLRVGTLLILDTVESPAILFMPYSVDYPRESLPKGEGKKRGGGLEAEGEGRGTRNWGWYVK